MFIKLLAVRVPWAPGCTLIKFSQREPLGSVLVPTNDELADGESLVIWGIMRGLVDCI